tara:strand:+ start:267 stop:494 length:228 start_codon:yes stop_codon:yes gene_type:complete
MKEFKVGDLVRDKLNQTDNSYGIGVVVDDDLPPTIGERWDRLQTGPAQKKYDVYFSKFGRTITFHGDYLERISKD